MINAPVSKNSENLKKEIISISPLYHNCALHTLIPFIYALTQGNEQAIFGSAEKITVPPNALLASKPKGFQYLAQAFQEYYQLTEQRIVEQKLATFLTQYAHLLDLQILLGPVLRLTLKKVLLESTTHQENLKPSFEYLLNLCRQRYIAEFPQGTHTEALVSWLRQEQFSRQEEFEELMVPNVELIATLLTEETAINPEESWQQVYQNYCAYVGDPTKGCYISENQLALLARSFDFKVICQTAEGVRHESLPADFTPLVTIHAVLTNGNHWEIEKNEAYNWVFDRISNPEAAFAVYHQIALEMTSCHPEEGQKQLLQEKFRQKIQALFSNQQAYKEKTYEVLPLQTTACFSGLEGLVHFIVEKLTKGSISSALNINFDQHYPGFESFFSAFCHYYELAPTPETLQNLNALLAQCDEIAHLMILSPVLRAMTDSTEQKPLSQNALINLYHLFRVELAIYANSDTGAVSEYQQLNTVFISNPLATCATALYLSTWRQVEKDPSTAFLAKLKQAYAPSSPLDGEQLKAQLQSYFATQAFPALLAANHRINIATPSQGSDEIALRKQNMLRAIEQRNLNLVISQLQQGGMLLANSAAELLKQSLDITLEEPQAASFGIALQSVFMLFYHLEKSKQKIEVKSFIELDSAALQVVKQALAQNAFKWVAQLHSYYENVPKLLAQEKVVPPQQPTYFGWIKNRFATYARAQTTEDQEKALLLYSKSNQQQILTLLAERACLAIDQRNKADLVVCIKAEPRCLLIPGKANPLHYAHEHKALSLAKEALLSVLQEQCQEFYATPVREEDLPAEFIKRIFARLAQQARDQFDRTLSFRLQRNKAKKSLSRQLPQADIIQQIKLRTALLGEKLKDSRIFIADQWYEKMNHTSRIQQKTPYKVGHPLLVALRMLGMVAPHGMLRFGLEVGSYLLPSYFKTPILNLIGLSAGYAASKLKVSPETARTYVPYVVENLFYLAAMPHYYLASTLLNTGVYYTLKNSGWENAEALAYLLTENMAHSWANGRMDLRLDERHQHQLSKSLAAVMSQEQAKALAPAIVKLEGVTQGANAAIHDSYEGLKANFASVGNQLAPVLSNPTFSTVASPFINGGKVVADSLSAVVAFNDKLVDVFKEPLFNYAEQHLLHYLPDSAFKTERLHTFTLKEVHSLGERKEQIEIELKNKKEQLAELEQICEKTQADITANTQAIAVLEKNMKRARSTKEKMTVPAFKERMQAQIDEAEKSKAALEEKISSSKSKLKKSKSIHLSLNKIIESLSQDLTQKTQLLREATHKEEDLFRKTEGYSYFEDWHEKFAELQYAEYSKPPNVAKIQACQQAERAAWEAFHIHSNDIMQQVALTQKMQLEQIFQQQAANFMDTSNLQAVANGIVDETFAHSEDRNARAAFAADKIISLKYPLYPALGDTDEIKKERQGYIDNISTYKLAAGKEKNQRKDLNGYLVAALSGQPEQVRPSHRKEVKLWIGKGIANIASMALSGGRMILFPDFFVGPSYKGGNQLNLQFNYNFGGTNNSFHTDLNYNDMRLVTISKNNQGSPSFTLLPQVPRVKDRASFQGQELTYASQFPALTSSTPSTLTAFKHSNELKAIEFTSITASAHDDASADAFQIRDEAQQDDAKTKKQESKRLLPAHKKQVKSENDTAVTSTQKAKRNLDSVSAKVSKEPARKKKAIQPKSSADTVPPSPAKLSVQIDKGTAKKPVPQPLNYGKIASSAVNQTPNDKPAIQGEPTPKLLLTNFNQKKRGNPNPAKQQPNKRAATTAKASLPVGTKKAVSLSQELMSFLPSNMVVPLPLPQNALPLLPNIGEACQTNSQECFQIVSPNDSLKNLTIRFVKSFASNLDQSRKDAGAFWGEEAFRFTSGEKMQTVEYFEQAREGFYQVANDAGSFIKKETLHVLKGEKTQTVKMVEIIQHVITNLVNEEKERLKNNETSLVVEIVSEQMEVAKTHLTEWEKKQTPETLAKGTADLVGELALALVGGGAIRIVKYAKVATVAKVSQKIGTNPPKNTTSLIKNSTTSQRQNVIGSEQLKANEKSHKSRISEKREESKKSQSSNNVVTQQTGEVNEGAGISLAASQSSTSVARLNEMLTEKALVGPGEKTVFQGAGNKEILSHYALRTSTLVPSVGKPVKVAYLGEFNAYKSFSLNIKVEAAKTFLGGIYKSYKIQEDIFLWRVASKESKKIGNYFTFTQPQSEIIARINYAIMPKWKSGGVSIVDAAYYIKVPKGTTIHVGRSAPQGGIFLGGMEQVYIENAVETGAQVIETISLKEEKLWNLQARSSLKK